MSYLYLNFVDNLDMGLGDKAWGRNDFFTQSLTDQYEKLKRKLGGYAPETLQELIGYIFPTTTKYYNISLPSFDRTPEENKRGNKVLRNIVIRPEADEYTKGVLPSTYDLIIIGDVTFGNVIDVTVKGIELIDSKIAKFGEKRVACVAACAFAKKTFVSQGRTITVADYGVREIHNAVLTNDFVNEIATQLYPVPNPTEAIRTLAKWQRYVDFRRYYLGKQSERSEEITDVTVCNAYMITKEAYRRNEEAFSALLLDGIKEFGKGEQVVLSKEVAGAEGFPLICVTIEKNRKAVLSDTMGRNGNGKPKFEVRLNRYTRDAMGLSPTPPKSDEKGNIKGLRSYLLGERYLFAHVDIEPELTALDKKFEKELASEYSAIESRYNGIISTELDRYMNGITAEILAKYERQLTDYKKELAEKLDQDVKNDTDREVSKAYQSEIKRLLTPLDEEKKKKHAAIRAEREKLEKSKLSREEIDEKREFLRSEEERIDREYAERVEKIKAGVSLREYYVRRNEMLIERKQKSLSIRAQEELENLKKQKRSQLEVQYSGNIASEKNAIKEELSQKLNEEKAEKIENETVRRYQIYFRPEDVTDKVKDIEKRIAEMAPHYLTYDNRAEKAKIDRQEKALASILGGYVKNPFLPTYLFSPQTLAQSSNEELKDPEWCLESLNDRQKLAVKRALASESMFLLQGPPGTGKTQVIAEITAQLTKQGKKVLISSETHKAIDNVFDRLPKIPEIRPLRLIPSTNGKETNYSPEKLMDNFYLNICGNLEKQVKRFENFEETKAVFDEQMRMLRFNYDKVLKLKRENAKIEAERSVIVEKINRLNSELEGIRAEMAGIKEREDMFRRTEKFVDSVRFDGEGVATEFIERYKREVQDLLLGFACFEEISLDKVGELIKLDDEAVREELAHLLSEDTLVQLKGRQQELRGILSSLRDPETDEAPEEGDANYEEYKKYQTELKDVVNKIKAAQSGIDYNVSESAIFTILPAIVGNKTLMKELPEELKMFKVKLNSIVFALKGDIEEKLDEVLNQEAEVSDRISGKQIEISEHKRRYEELSEDKGVEEYGELNSALKQKITRFFRDFDIIKEYDSDNLETAFQIIAEEWSKLERNYKATQAENKVKIPMYKEIVKYLSQEDILEEDRAAYTRELYNSANVFGITCTSRDRFTPAQLEELGRYGIESVDIRTVGIDVVIIDEVSKSSYLDLLIPILYGKTIILVGDHRQLPPMYDLRHMRADDFEGLDEEIITKEINDGYTKLYEECFFKTLYEKVPKEFKLMLNKQYRCHSHIMEVFNHFYGGSNKGLIVGKKQQDDEKEHNLTVRINGNTVIDPIHHIYFVDCDQKESSAFEGSTSKINEQEAQVAMTLLKELDMSSKELVSQRKIIVDPAKKIDERPSVGIICTYGDQAGLIKKKRKYQQFTGFSGRPDERLIISTVDDFQGDERDIIIVSMVRNPAQGKRYDAEFIKKFERINVAFSRARKLLIIVGSRKFLSEAGIIDLPDLDGDHSQDKLNFPVYREIIDTINFRGRILTAKDILGE